MRPQTLFYHRLLIGRTAVRPYTRNLGQPTFPTSSKACGSAGANEEQSEPWASAHGPCGRYLCRGTSGAEPLETKNETGVEFELVRVVGLTDDPASAWPEGTAPIAGRIRINVSGGPASGHPDAQMITPIPLHASPPGGGESRPAIDAISLDVVRRVLG